MGTNVHKTVVTDVDDVLVHISAPWVRRALARPRFRCALQSRLPPAQALEQAVLSRRFYHVQTWLLEDLGMSPELRDEFDAVYREDSTFYDDLQPTSFCQGIILALEETRAIQQVHVITHVFAHGDPVNASKRRWLQRWLRPGELPVVVHEVEGHLKKSDIMREHCPESDLFADDAMKNVIDVLSAEGVHVGEILLPRMGHNSPALPDVELLAELRRTAIGYYLNVL